MHKTGSFVHNMIILNVLCYVDEYGVDLKSNFSVDYAPA